MIWRVIHFLFKLIILLISVLENPMARSRMSSMTETSYTQDQTTTQFDSDNSQKSGYFKISKQHWNFSWSGWELESNNATSSLWNARAGARHSRVEGDYEQFCKYKKEASLFEKCILDKSNFNCIFARPICKSNSIAGRKMGKDKSSTD